MRNFAGTALVSKSRVVLVMVALFVTAIQAALGQNATGQISGRVTDASGAVTVGATVTITEVQTQFKHVLRTNSDGLYVAPLLPPGSYNITVEQAGFNKVSIDIAKLDVNQTITENVTLTVGSVSTQIDVSGTPELLQTESSNLGTVIAQRTVQDTPLNGRNFTQLTILTPGATPIYQLRRAQTLERPFSATRAFREARSWPRPYKDSGTV
jgi:Carboxypeptidase regulatory-like domain